MKDSSIRRFSLVPYALALVAVGALVVALTWPAWGNIPSWLANQNAPAWAQALLSAAAIWFSGRFAVAQHRLEIRQRTDVALAMASQVCDEIELWVDRVSEGIFSAAATHWDFGDFQRIADGLLLIPLHELPHMAMVRPVVSIQRNSASLLRSLDEIQRKAHNGFPITSADNTKCRDIGIEVAAARDALLAVKESDRAWYKRLAGL